MAIADDFSVNNVTGNIRYTGSGTATYTVLEFHRWLQDLADDASAAGDDLVDITSETPSDRSTDNIITLLGLYNIDPETAQYLYDGSITQKSGDEIYSGLVVVGSVNRSTTLMIIQNNILYEDGLHDPTFPFWGTGLNADAGNNILMRCMIRTRVNGSNVDGQRIRVQARELGDTYAEFNVTMGLGNSTAAIFTGNDLNNATDAANIQTWSSIVNIEGYQGIDIQNGAGTRFYYSQWDYGSQSVNDLYERAKWIQRNGATKFTLQTTLSGGTETSVVITTNVPLDLPATNGTIEIQLDSGAYQEVNYTSYTGQTFTISSTSFSGDNATAGNEVILFFNALNLNTTLSGGTETSVVTTEPIPTGFPASGTLRVQLDSGNFQEVSYSSFTSSTFTITSADFSGDNATSGNKIIVPYNTIHTIRGELFRGITTQWNYDSNIAAFNENEVVTWPSGTGLLLALDETTGSTGTMWIQLLTGTAPSDNDYINSSTGNCRVAGSTTSRTVSPAFIGQSTGSALIGAFGIGVDPNDLTSSDLLFDLTNTSQTPPNFVTFSVAGLQPLEDYVLVGPLSGGVLQVNQYAASGNSASDTTLQVTTTIDSDTPSSGNIRAWDGNSFVKLTYSSYDNSTFVLGAPTATLPTNISASANVFISYIDELVVSGNVASFTTIFSSSRSLFVRVRDGGNTPIKTFETEGTLGSAGGSVTAIRTNDF